MTVREKKEIELRKELVKLNAQVAMGTQIKSPGQISQVKRNIARIKTEIKHKIPISWKVSCKVCIYDFKS